MSEPCVCGGSPAQPNPDCERCQLVARIAQLEAEVERLKEVLQNIANEGDTVNYGHLLPGKARAALQPSTET